MIRLSTASAKYPLLLAIFATMLISLSSRGAEWDAAAAVAVGSFYSNNICLALEEEEGEAAGTLTPSVRLSGTGARASINLSAAAQYNSLADSSIECPQGGVGGQFGQQENWVPRLNFTANAVAIENWLSLDANASARQNAINPFGAGADDNANIAGNTNITYRAGIGATIEHQFSQKWALLARYNYNEQDNTAETFLGASQEDRADLSFGVIPETSRLSYGVTGRYSEVSFDETLGRPEFTNRLSSIAARTALNLSNSWRVNATVGEEDNVFTSESDDIDGEFWDVGLRWAPNSRIEFNMGYGERFFGETPRFDLSYSHKRSSITASYLRDIRFPRNIRGGVATDGESVDVPFESDAGVVDDVLESGNDPTFIGQSPVLIESFQLRYGFSARRTSFALLASLSEQQRAEDGRQSEFQTYTFSASRSLGARVNATAGLSYIQNEGFFDANAADLVTQDRETWRLNVGLTRSLTESTNLRLTYRFTDQNSSQVRNEFEEHRLALSIRFTF